MYDRFFPKRLSPEFLVVDLVNNLDRLAENRNEVLTRVKQRVGSFDRPRLERAARDYGRSAARGWSFRAQRTTLRSG